jgi:rubrerythrin
MDRTDIVATLCKLQRMDADAVQVYQDAIDQIGDGEIKQQLQTFQQDHRHHQQEIEDFITQQNWDQVEPTPQFEMLMQGFRQQVDMAQGGDDAVLFAMDLGEKVTNAEYAEALQLDVDASAQAVLQRNLADEKRHLEFIESHIPRGLRMGGGGESGGGVEGGSAGNFRVATTGEGGIPYGSSSGDAGAYGGMGGDVGPGGGGSGPATERDSREATPGGDVTADYGMGGRGTGQHAGIPPRRGEKGGALDADTRLGITSKGSAMSGGGTGAEEGHPNFRGQVEGDGGNSGSGVAGSGSGD